MSIANDPSARNLPKGDQSNFWKRQTRKDRVAIATFGIELFLSVALVLAGVLISSKSFTLQGRLALLTGNVFAIVAVLQFAMSRFFDDQKDQIDNLGGEIESVNIRISQTLETMESIAALGETYVKIFRQEEGIKNQYQNTLDGFLRRLSNCIDDKRSGALDIMDYYSVLEDLAVSIEKDKDACDIVGRRYEGGIWALTFLLDDEWDDGNIHEAKWFSSLKRLDSEGIPTRRLWAFDVKMLALVRKEPIEEEGRELVRRLALYCAENTDFKNTQSFALPKGEILDEHVRLFGKGFFAAAFSNGESSLIRGVCFDNLLSSNSLGGEVDFDAARINQIRFQWERYLVLAKPLKEYLEEAASPSAKEFMRTIWTVAAPTS